MGVVRCVVLGLLVLLAIGQTATAEVVCKLHMEGFGSKYGIRMAHLSCTGGSIKAVAHPLLAPLLGAKAGEQSSGVQWVAKCEPEWTIKCMLMVCNGSEATFTSTTVMHLNMSEVAAGPRNWTNFILCMGYNSSLTFKGALFDGNSGRAISGGGSLHIQTSQFTNNVVPGAKHHGGVLYAEAGTTVVESSNFVSNGVEYRGGAIAVKGGSRLKVLSSVFKGNKGMCWCGQVPMPYCACTCTTRGLRHEPEAWHDDDLH
jgi:hypothetical protein